MAKLYDMKEYQREFASIRLLVWKQGKVVPVELCDHTWSYRPTGDRIVMHPAQEGRYWELAE